MMMLMSRIGLVAAVIGARAARAARSASPITLGTHDLAVTPGVSQLAPGVSRPAASARRRSSLAHC